MSIQDGFEIDCSTQTIRYINRMPALKALKSGTRLKLIPPFKISRPSGYTLQQLYNYIQDSWDENEQLDAITIDASDQQYKIINNYEIK
jgi:hypothetical protein